MKWNYEIFTLNVNEKLYLLIFLNRICPKYFQNSRMVFMWKKLSVLFRCKCIPKYQYCLIEFFSAIEPSVIIVVIVSVAPTVSCSAEKLFSILRIAKTNLRRVMGQDILSHLALICIERACVNRVDFQSILDQKT